MSNRPRLVVVLALACLLILAGCTGGAGGNGATGGDSVSGGDGAQLKGDRDHDVDAGARPESEAGGGDGGDDGAAQFRAQVESRSIVRTGTVVVEVDRFDSSRRNLTGAVRDYGGFVAATDERNHPVGNESYATGRVVLRVPQENYSALSARIAEEGEVLEASNETEDVTDQLVDMEARLENLRAERDRLRDLYREANETEDVLAVEERLSEVQTEIERVEARQQSLQRRVAYSTITVELREPRPDRGPIERTQWYDTPVGTAFVDSVHGVVVVLRALVVGLAYALPYLLVFVPAASVAYLAWRRFGPLRPTRRRAARRDDAAADEDDSDAATDGTRDGADPDDAEADDADADESPAESDEAADETDETAEKTDETADRTDGEDAPEDRSDAA